MRCPGRLIVAAVSVLSVSGCADPNAPSANEIAGREFDLPIARETAYEILLKTQVFASSRVGAAGMVPNQVHALRAILRQDDAARIFKDLLANAELAGKLYALCGLYLTDRELFDREVKPFRQMNKEVWCLIGCSGGPRPVRSIVDPAHTDSPFTILNGGFPRSFRDVHTE